MIFSLLLPFVNFLKLIFWTQIAYNKAQTKLKFKIIYDLSLRVFIAMIITFSHEYPAHVAVYLWAPQHESASLLPLTRLYIILFVPHFLSFHLILRPRAGGFL